MLSMSLYASLRVAFGAQRSAEAAVEPPRTAAAVLDLVGQDLQAAAPIGLVATQYEGTDGTDDRGRPGDDVIFYSVADSPLHAAANGDIKQIELAVQTSPNGTDHLLVRKVTRNLLSATATPNPDVEVLCRGVGGFNLRYYNGDTWADSWDSTQEDNTIPAAVEVTLTLERAGDHGAVHIVQVRPRVPPAVLDGGAGLAGEPQRRPRGRFDRPTRPTPIPTDADPARAAAAARRGGGA